MYNLKHMFRKNKDIIRQKSLITPRFEPLEAQNDIFLTIFGQNVANLKMAKKQIFQLQLQQAASRGLSTSDRLSGKELSKYRLKPPKFRVRGTPKKPDKKLPKLILSYLSVISPSFQNINRLFAKIRMELA